MITLRRAEERGHAQHGWLDTYHTFSFNTYYDKKYMGFRALRVINDDRVQPGRGFGFHPHRDMEIITYVLSGELEHKDSMGNGSIIKTGDFQYMSAGNGVMHSEFNPSKTEPVHLLQIWIVPKVNGGAPQYAQRSYPEKDRLGKFVLIASPDGQADSFIIKQDARLYSAIIDTAGKITTPIVPDRYAWLHVATGSIVFDKEILRAGDGAAISREATPNITGIERSELLLFDLA